MIANHESTWKRREPRGVSIVIVAVGMLFILGMAGLAIDLASLYVGRSQAQRAADAAALAGAQALVDGSCLDGTISPTCQAAAQQQAAIVGNQNLIAGVSPGIQPAAPDVTVDVSNPNDPQVTVIAARDTARGNAMPTFFVKIFGISTANVSAKATAEAFNPSGTGIPIGVKCVKPWFLPNCDANNANPAQQQSTTNCAPIPGTSTQPGAYVLDQDFGYSKPVVARPGAYANGGVFGQPITMKPGSPGSAAAPGQYYAAYIPNDTNMPAMCPSCALSGGSGGPGTGSAAVYRANIECCNQNSVVCGVQTVKIASSAGNMVGPTRQGVDCLIHQAPGCGQDYLEGTQNPPCNPASSIPNYPFKVLAGPNNNLAQGAPSVPMSASDSVVAVPIYKGILQSGQNQVNVIGFMKIFLKYEDQSQQGTLYGYVLDITACGSGGSGTGTGGTGSGVISTGGTTIPVRLIRTGS